MCLRLLVCVLAVALFGSSDLVLGQDKVRLVMLGDTTLFGYNVPAEEALPLRLVTALSTADRPVEIIKSHNIDTTKSALIWLITKSAKTVLADPKGAALILSVGYWDCGGMSLEQTRTNLADVMKIFHDKNVPILLVEVEPRTFCGADYNESYSSIFPLLAEQFGALLYKDKTPPPPDERPEGVNYITRPVPYEDILPYVEQLLGRIH